MTLAEPVRELLRSCVIARVGTTDPDGRARVAPFWVAFDGDRIYLDTLDNRTTRNLRRDPRVAVLADEGTTFAELRGALIRGVARLWTEHNAPPHVRAGIESLRAAHADEIATAAFDSYAARETRDVVLVEVIPERADSWDLGSLAGA